MSQRRKWLVTLVGIVLAGDLVFLTWWVIRGRDAELLERLALLERQVDSLIKRDGQSGSLEDEVLVNRAAAEAVKSLKPELEAREQPVPTNEPEQVLGDTDTSVLREYFVPLGNGSTTAREWSDVGALQATVNIDRYGEVAAMWFEGSLRSVNGLAEARLLDKTSGAVIHESNLSYGDNQFGWVFSKPFKLEKGGRTLVVQMRGSTGEMVEMSGARLRIEAKQ